MSQKNYKSATHIDFFISLLLTTSLVFTLFLSFLPASSSAAEESDPQCHGSWNGLKWKDFPGSGAQNGVYSEKGRYADIEFGWKFNDPVKEGDALHIDLPAELKAATTNTVDLRDSHGEHVANGRWKDNQFVITATDYAKTHLNITGTARLSVTWNRSNDHVKTGGEINLEFSGCGKEALKGNIGPDGPPGFHHDNGKQGEYRAEDSSIIWSIGVNGTDQQEKPFTVTDTAPAGWKFVCEPTNSSDFPTYVKTLVNLPNTHPTKPNLPIWMDHVVFLPKNTTHHSNFNPEKRWGHAGKIFPETVYEQMKKNLLGKPKNPESYWQPDFNAYSYFGKTTFSDTPAYTLSCSPDKITANFPYGISAEYDIIIQAKTVLSNLSNKPEPGSIVTNQVHIGDKIYEGDVFIPGASGNGQGLLGGFVLGKRVEGINSNELNNKEFEFSYTCSHSSSTSQTGTVKVKANSYYHVKNVAKNSTCTITENLGPATLNNSLPTVRWRIGREDVAAPQFTIPDSHNGQDYPAVQVTAINSYDNPPKPAPAKVEIRKEVIASDSSAVSKADANDWTFTLTDGSYTKSITTKNSDIKNNKSVSASETVMFDVPVNTTASVTITEDIAQKSDYLLKNIVCSAMPKTDPETITVTRLTDTSVSVAGIRAGDTVSCVATNEKHEPQKPTGSVTWSKVDSENQAHFLSNSEWLLNHITNGKATDITLITDCTTAPCPASSSSDPVDMNPEPGKFTITGLPQGKYTLVEKTAPAGYFLSDKTYPFTLGEVPEQLNIALDPIPNTKITPPQLPLTGGTGTLPFVIGGLALIGFAGAIMLRQRLTIK
ncbi:Ig-like domain-containing protein [Arcanobacterium phocae]|uniref:Ig-like domain-containing protein n=4 Tax=Arcanobacterium phocae TaxID=131112 RepID=UPI001C0F2269|nr:Ig-like domain-containing protein [Arcanobacterium phocae]